MLRSVRTLWFWKRTDITSYYARNEYSDKEKRQWNFSFTLYQIHCIGCKRTIQIHRGVARGIQKEPKMHQLSWPWSQGFENEWQKQLSFKRQLLKIKGVSIQWWKRQTNLKHLKVFLWMLCARVIVSSFCTQNYKKLRKSEATSSW